MAKASSNRRTRPAAAPASSCISKFGRVSKNYGPASKTDKKVLAVCLPNSRTLGPVAITCIDDASDEENKAPTVLPPTEAKLGMKRKAESTDDAASTNAAIASRGVKRSRVLTQVPANISLDSTLTAQNKKAKPSTKKAEPSKKPAPEALAPKARQQLPVELMDLLNLQKAILKTVVLQLTHQYRSTPIDIATITPQVTRTWGKRQVTVDDIRRCIAVQDFKSDGGALRSPFTVSDFGRGNMCLELVDIDGPPINERKLCKQFEDNLHAMCANRAVDEMSDLDISFESLSFTDLPKSEITKRHGADRLNPVLAKGARALNELKQSLATKQQEREAKANAPKLSPLDAFAGKMSLLDRLRAKEAARAQMDLPSGPELARQRALQRIGEVASIIGMLVNASNPTGMPALSYTMATLQQKLKDSLRVPMPLEEGIDSIKLIANEIAPEWLRVVSLGGKEHVVIQTRSKPYDSEITARVNKLVA